MHGNANSFTVQGPIARQSLHNGINGFKNNPYSQNPRYDHGLASNDLTVHTANSYNLHLRALQNLQPANYGQSNVNNDRFAVQAPPHQTAMYTGPSNLSSNRSGFQTPQDQRYFIDGLDGSNIDSLLVQALHRQAYEDYEGFNKRNPYALQDSYDHEPIDDGTFRAIHNTYATFAPARYSGYGANGGNMNTFAVHAQYGLPDLQQRRYGFYPNAHTMRSPQHRPSINIGFSSGNDAPLGIYGMHTEFSAYNGMNGPQKERDDGSDLQETYPNPLWSSHSPVYFTSELDNACRRVPVAPSTFYAYSRMRGKTDKPDPLRHALYQDSSRNVCPDPVWIAEGNRAQYLEELPKHTTLFWDPLKNISDEDDRLVLPSRPSGDVPKHLQTTYAEHIRQNPPNIGSNHYKGDMSLANFGYVKIGGNWVDPDGEGNLYDAFEDEKDGLGVSLGDLGRQSTIVGETTGPRVMSLWEEEGFYQDYVEGVTDHVDGEGDPREWRITPETFARWAAGASSGEHFEETPFTTPPKLPSPDPKSEELVSPKPRINQQYDMDTGSVMSGFYDAEADPVMLHKPQGVNVIRPPPCFSYSYPKIGVDLDRQAFGASPEKPATEGGHLRRVDSIADMFTSKNEIRKLDPTPSTFSAGPEIFEATETKILSLREETDFLAKKLIKAAYEAHDAADRRVQISREVFFLKQVLASPSGVPLPSSTIPYSPSSKSPDPITPDQPIDISKTTPPGAPLKKHYKRYLDEQLSDAEITYRKTKMLGQRVEGEHKEIFDEIAELMREKAELLRKLGVEEAEDVPGLMPGKGRGDERKEWNEQFGKVL